MVQYSGKGGESMGKKKVFYLDPDDRKWTMEDLGLSWDDLELTDEKVESIEGVFFANNGKIISRMELPNHCPDCLDTLAYNDEFDSIYCEDCDEWRDSPCTDPSCEYCSIRPEKPSDCN
jgi:hypothetical protein